MLESLAQHKVAIGIVVAIAVVLFALKHRAAQAASNDSTGTQVTSPLYMGMSPFSNGTQSSNSDNAPMIIPGANSNAPTSSSIADLVAGLMKSDSDAANAQKQATQSANDNDLIASIISATKGNGLGTAVTVTHNAAGTVVSTNAPTPPPTIRDWTSDPAGYLIDSYTQSFGKAPNLDNPSVQTAIHDIVGLKDSGFTASQVTAEVAKFHAALLSDNVPDNTQIYSMP